MLIMVGYLFFWFLFFSVYWHWPFEHADHGRVAVLASWLNVGESEMVRESIPKQFLVDVITGMK